MRPVQIQDPFLWGEWFGVYWFHMAPPMDGIVHWLPKRLGYGLSQMVIEQEGDVSRVFLSRSEWTNIGEHYLVDVRQKPSLLASLLLDTRTAKDGDRVEVDASRGIVKKIL